jgi:hypothetical protein
VASDRTKEEVDAFLASEASRIQVVITRRIVRDDIRAARAALEELKRKAALLRRPTPKGERVALARTILALASQEPAGPSPTPAWAFLAAAVEGAAGYPDAELRPLLARLILEATFPGFKVEVDALAATIERWPQRGRGENAKWTAFHKLAMGAGVRVPSAKSLPRMWRHHRPTVAAWWGGFYALRQPGIDESGSSSP